MDWPVLWLYVWGCVHAFMLAAHEPDESDSLLSLILFSMCWPLVVPLTVVMTLYMTMKEKR